MHADGSPHRKGITPVAGVLMGGFGRPLAGEACDTGQRKVLRLRWFPSACVCWDARSKASSFPFSTCAIACPAHCRLLRVLRDSRHVSISCTASTHLRRRVEKAYMSQAQAVNISAPACWQGCAQRSLLSGCPCLLLAGISSASHRVTSRCWRSLQSL